MNDYSIFNYLISLLPFFIVALEVAGIFGFLWNWIPVEKASDLKGRT